MVNGLVVSMLDILIVTRDVQRSDDDDRIIETQINLSYAMSYNSLADPYNAIPLLDFYDMSNGTYMNSNEIHKRGRNSWKGLIRDPVSSSRIIKTNLRLKLRRRQLVQRW